ncbi:hypothetical protein AB0C48_29180, partial [Streptomyces sp. NPDC048556]|uniref:hypothetical protein n=1 Tax=Streptomyces sp. NPDC048556 TaxID=3156664 RepID=UPI00341C0044
QLLGFGLALILLMRFRPEGLIANRRAQLEFHDPPGRRSTRWLSLSRTGLTATRHTQCHRASSTDSTTNAAVTPNTETTSPLMPALRRSLSARTARICGDQPGQRRGSA